MTHGDDNGLVLPPAVAPTQVIIIPVQQHKEGVLDAAEALRARLADKVRVKVDSSDNSPGWKFAEYEMKGVPLRIEIGPRDIENGQCVIVRRDNREKIFTSLDNIEAVVAEQLDKLTKALYEKALENRKQRTFEATELDDFIKIANEKSGYIKAMWCGDLDCELKLKEVADVTSRCMPMEQEAISDKCICCGKKADKLVYWGKAY
jgi:prolyl-tRNA synthetase